MNTDQLLTQIILFIVPGLMVLLVTYVILKKFFENEERRRFYQLRMDNQRISLPIRLQSYERLALLMERLSINNLILRVKKQGMSANDLQGALLAEVRAEFDHNLSQQIYVSHEAWQMIVNAKESVIKLINLSYSSLPQGASSLDLSKVIFENSMREETSAPYNALIFMKQEAKELF
jgi:hypothetical protein